MTGKLHWSRLYLPLRARNMKIRKWFIFYDQECLSNFKSSEITGQTIHLTPYVFHLSHFVIYIDYSNVGLSAFLKRVLLLLLPLLDPSKRVRQSSHPRSLLPSVNVFLRTRMRMRMRMRRRRRRRMRMRRMRMRRRRMRRGRMRRRRMRRRRRRWRL